MKGKSFAEIRAEQRARELATCRHFNGIRNPTCRAGVPYSYVRDPPSGKSRAKFACMDADCSQTCAKRELRTEAEIDAAEAEHQRRFALVVPARAAIKATRLASGTIDCPLCQKPGALAFRVSSYNGHIHAACSTPNCLSWME